LALGRLLSGAFASHASDGVWVRGKSVYYKSRSQ